MTGPTVGESAGSRRTYTVTAALVVHSDADLGDPFTRVAVFRAMVDHLKTAPLVVDTPYGAATGVIRLVTAVA
jgi:hypothetical protein